MSGNKLLRRLRKFHKWPSIVIAVFVIFFALSGIVLNHRDLFSGIDVSRKYLPEDYHYHNWNNAAVRSYCSLSPDSILIYGNIGIWLTDSSFTSFEDLNQGFPEGIDHRKVFKVHKSAEGELYAGTLFGLYHFDDSSKKWYSVEADFTGHEVVDILDRKGKLYILTRSFVYIAFEEAGSMEFEKRVLPPPLAYDGKEGLFKTLWVIHSGEIGGIAGQIFVDILGLSFIFLTITGILYWLFPKWIRKRKRNKKPFQRILGVKRFSLKWHNKIGYWFVFFLIITTLTGMFLRPPLLIAIANTKVAKIPYSMLDKENPWYDKLRRIEFDEASGDFIIGTNEGFYRCDSGMKENMQAYPVQPPISVMGINVFEQVRKDNYLVGSFNGLFLWQPGSGLVLDVFEPTRQVSPHNTASPIGKHMTAGLIDLGKGRLYHFDYGQGVQGLNTTRPFPAMTEEIRQKSPMSLWNLALEFHTARIYSVLIGDFYILFIPLFGLTLLTVLVTGLWLYLKIYHRKRAVRQ